MSQSKEAYFQGGGGVNEPTPKKKKYKSEPALVMQPRFKEPLYRNYDLYDVPGKHGPGAGLYQNMDKYKSVDDFIKKKRKKMKDKYKSDDSWQLDSGERVKKKSSIQARMALLNRIVKHAIDFPIDDDITPIHRDTESYYKPNQLGPEGKDISTFPAVTNLGDYEAYSSPLGIGGRGDKYLAMPDFEGKSQDHLDFGRNYTSENHCPNCGFIGDRLTGDVYDATFPCPQCGEGGVQENKDIDLDELTDKYLRPAEPALYGLPDGISPPEDLDAPNNENPQYGETDSGNTLYDKMWI